MTNLIFVKFGGAVITDKTTPNTLRPDILSRLTQELKRAQHELKDSLLVLGHGSGSFAHVPAAKYGTAHGYRDDDSAYGAALVQDSAAQLNRHVVAECLKQELPAVSICPSSIFTASNGAPSQGFLASALLALKNRQLPVVYGDVVQDDSQGCTIFSTEKVFHALQTQLPSQYEVVKIVYVTQVAGMMKDISDPKSLISDITPSNADEVQTYIQQVEGTDVTGGMWHKIQESLELTAQGIQTDIIGGTVPDTLYRCLTEKSFVGTKIHS